MTGLLAARDTHVNVVTVREEYRLGVKTGTKRRIYQENGENYIIKNSIILI
jgi:hypothetical protein